MLTIMILPAELTVYRCDMKQRQLATTINWVKVANFVHIDFILVENFALISNIPFHKFTSPNIEYQLMHFDIVRVYQWAAFA